MALEPPKCVFCGADWDDPMIDDYHHSKGCDTCGYGAETTFRLEINCSGCQRLVYVKECKQ